MTTFSLSFICFLALGWQIVLGGQPRRLEGLEDPPTTPDPVNETDTSTSQPRIKNKKSLRMANGIIQSENYPNNYPNNVDKTYTINTSPGDLIEMKFVYFALEFNSRCYYDWVMIKDGSGTTLLPKTCGYSTPAIIKSQSNSVEIIFHSDYSVTKKGFRIEWKSVNDESEVVACGTAPHNPKNHRGAESANIKLWTNGLVPFEITSYMNADDEAVVRRAMSDIEASTCIRFKERDGESAYIRMSRACYQSTGECIDSSAALCDDNGCFQGGWVQGGLGEKSPSGLFIGRTSVSITSQSSIGFLTHEVLHSLGVEHTQRRPDRDEYIDVKEENINCLAQYTRCPTCLTYDTPYDCKSVMHYRDYYCAKDGGQPTMTPAAGNTNCDLHSSARVLTSADKELLNRMYQCRSGCCGSLSVAGKHFASGNYIKTNELHNNKPVYKHSSGKWCVFYGGFWKIEMCGWLEISDNSQGYGWSKVNAECPEHIGDQWRYYKFGGPGFSGLNGYTAQGPIDTSIVVKCDDGCCNSLNVVGKYFANGEYKKTSEQHNGSPVYKHTGNGSPGWCIFFGGHWKIEACDFLDKANGDWSRGYGWSNVNAMCPGNIGPQWRYYSWSGGSGSGPVDVSIEVECI